MHPIYNTIPGPYERKLLSIFHITGGFIFRNGESPGFLRHQHYHGRFKLIKEFAPVATWKGNKRRLLEIEVGVGDFPLEASVLRLEGCILIVTISSVRTENAWRRSSLSSKVKQSSRSNGQRLSPSMTFFLQINHRRISKSFM